ncbi:MAG: hypothetical protein KBA75_00940 [Alphaproteobacteria bacterium]|nr:hypothetical protein [Alphaproteobacteria bacterium]
MYDQADIVFYGRLAAPDTKEGDSLFEYSRVAKSSIKLGSAKISAVNSVNWNAMCGGHYQPNHDYLVFIKLDPTSKALRMMNDCYADTVSSDGMKYHFRNQDFVDFPFFRVNPLSAVNGVRPLYADAIKEDFIKDFAVQRVREWRRANAQPSILLQSLTVPQARLLHDDYGQPYWQVRVEPTVETRAGKGDFQILDIYSTSSDDIIIHPGK